MENHSSTAFRKHCPETLVPVWQPEPQFGTLGYFCTSKDPADPKNQVYLLSNNHVLADVNNGAPGDEVLQPGPADGGTIPKDTVANLTRFQPIALGGPPHVNEVDAARKPEEAP